MVIDASVWISYFLGDDVNHHVSTLFLERMIGEARSLAAPAILLLEVAGAVSRRSHLPELGLDAAVGLRTVAQLTLLPMNDELLRLSIQAAATLALRGADAAYVATAEMLQFPLVSWDIDQRTRGKAVVPTLSPLDVNRPATTTHYRLLTSHH